MRKLRYAGAALAGGIILFGAAPAQADLLPGTGTAEQQADERLADLLGKTNGITVDPLGHSTLNGGMPTQPRTGLRTGQNQPSLDPLLPGESATEPPHLPAADVVGSGLRRPPARPAGPGWSLPIDDLPMRRFPIHRLPVFDTGGLPLFAGLLPDGGPGVADDRATLRQAEMFDGGMPLLGGLGGLLPVNGAPRTLPAAGAEPDASGMPAGGTAVRPDAQPAAPVAAATDAPAGPATSAPGGASPAPVTATPPAAATATSPATTSPATSAPATQKPARHKAAKPRPVATPDDPRLHEEPVDDEAEQRRPFSADGRPVAGIDEQYR